MKIIELIFGLGVFILIFIQLSLWQKKKYCHNLVHSSDIIHTLSKKVTSFKSHDQIKINLEKAKCNSSNEIYQKTIYINGKVHE